MKKVKTMKNMIWMSVVGICCWCWGCQEVTVGYLNAENAKYIPNRMEIRLVLDEELDASGFIMYLPG